jgi:hypothetical protein
MATEKVFTGFAKDKKLQFGTITQLSWNREQYEELGNYFNDSGYINVDIMRAKNGNPYMSVSTYGVSGSGGGSVPIAPPAPLDEDVPY